MSDHNITPQFSSANSEPKRPWYKRPITYIIGVPVLLVILIVNGIVGDGVAGKKAVHEPLSQEVEVTEPEVVETAEPVEAEAAPEPVEVQPSTRDVALVVLREGWPYFAQAGDDVIDTAALAVCDALDSGVSFEAYVLVAADSGIPAEEAGALIGYAANVYCPQHLGITEGY